MNDYYIKRKVWENLSLPEKANEYFRLTKNRENWQIRFWNDWRNALELFEQAFVSSI